MSYRNCIVWIAAFIIPLTINSNSDILAYAQDSKFNIKTVPLSVYMLDDDSGKFSTPSKIKRILVVFNKVNEIWSQAGIRFEIDYIGRIPVPNSIIRDVINGNYKPFIQGREVKFEVPSSSRINVFYAYEVGLLNGITLEDRVVIIKDSPGSQTERVTAHELGHNLGLHHAHEDSLRLMYPGTSGTVLTSQETKTARNNASSQ